MGVAPLQSPAKVQFSPAFEALVQACAGAGSSAFSALALHPVEVVKTRIQTGGLPSASPLTTAKAIFKYEGLAAFYRGVVAKCLEDALEGFIFYYLYDACIKMAKRWGKITPWHNLALGFIAGVGTTSCVMPLEVIGTKLQAAGIEGGKNQTFMTTLVNVVRQEGLGGLMKGFWLNVMLCLNPAVQNTTFDRARLMLLRRKERLGTARVEMLQPFEAFALGALSKALAITMCYPLMRFKTVVQAGGSLNVAPEPMQSALASLYRGLSSALAKNVLGGALMYMAKDQIVSRITAVLHSIALSRQQAKLLQFS